MRNRLRNPNLMPLISPTLMTPSTSKEITLKHKTLDRWIIKNKTTTTTKQPDYYSVLHDYYSVLHRLKTIVKQFFMFFFQHFKQMR